MENSHRIYLDNAATTKISLEVFSAMQPILYDTYGNPSSVYKEGQKAKSVLEDARRRVACVLDAEPSEIFFTSSGTESDNWAIKGYAFRHANEGRHIITTQIEHHAILDPCESFEKMGYTVTYLAPDSSGRINPEHLRAAIKEDTILVSVMTANNETGVIQPINEMAEICKEKRVCFHTDAVQAIGSIPVSVREMGVDMLSISGHKIYGPKGVGALYIRKGITVSKFMEGGNQERARRGSTENIPGIIGLCAAMENAKNTLAEEMLRIRDIRDALTAGILEKIPDCRLNGHPSYRLPGHVNFSFSGVESESLLLLLDREGYACSGGSACTSGSLDPSHVLLAMGVSRGLAQGSLRMTIGKYNTKEDVLSIIPVLERTVRRLREITYH